VTMTAQTYALTRMTGALGARVDGLDLSRPLADETMNSLRAALYEHCVLIFSGQGDLTAEQQIAFGRNWGELISMPPEVDLVDGHAELFRIRTQPKDSDPHWHDDWHSDWTFLERPPFVSILAAKKLPDVGGDTMWAPPTSGFPRRCRNSCTDCAPYTSARREAARRRASTRRCGPSPRPVGAPCT
jgi:alpha-ketoglutarate-dependent taurine dioxygenase